MLRKLTPQHRDIILRLVAGQAPHKIAIELGIHSQTISNLKTDPLFAAELRDLEQSAKKALLDRITAMELLEQTTNDMARVINEGVSQGEIDGEPISAKTRLDAAFKLLGAMGLDRSKTKKEDSSQESLADLVIDAYERGRDGRKKDAIEVSPEECSDVPLAGNDNALECRSHEP